MPKDDVHYTLPGTPRYCGGRRVLFSRANSTVRDRFADAVDVVYDEIISAPYRNRVVQYGLREKKLKGFPFAILYNVEESGIVIVAIYHDRRKRAKLRNRI